MQCNVGGTDQTVRYLIGAGALAAALLAPRGTTGKVVLLATAGIAGLTATVGFCPLNKLLGVDTCMGR